MHGKVVLVCTDRTRTWRQVTPALAGAGNQLVQAPSSERAEDLLRSGAIDLALVEWPSGIDLDRVLEAARDRVPVVALVSETGIRALEELICRRGILHLCAARPEQEASAARAVDAAELVVTCEKILRRDIFGLDKYLAGFGIERPSRIVVHAEERDAVVAQLGDSARALGAGRRIVESVSLVGDELFTNAVYNAPRDADGRPRYAHVSRREKIALEPREYVRIEFGSDGRTFGLAVRDCFGALQPSSLRSSIERCVSRHDPIEQKEGGAGIGLYAALCHADHLVFNLAPGLQTEVIALWNLTRRTGGRGAGVASLHVFELAEEAAAEEGSVSLSDAARSDVFAAMLRDGEAQFTLTEPRVAPRDTVSESALPRPLAATAAEVRAAASDELAVADPDASDAIQAASQTEADLAADPRPDLEVDGDLAAGPSAESDVAAEADEQLAAEAKAAAEASEDRAAEAGELAGQELEAEAEEEPAGESLAAGAADDLAAGAQDDLVAGAEENAAEEDVAQKLSSDEELAEKQVAEEELAEEELAEEELAAEDGLAAEDEPAAEDELAAEADLDLAAGSGPHPLPEPDPEPEPDDEPLPPAAAFDPDLDFDFDPALDGDPDIDSPTEVILSFEDDLSADPDDEPDDPPAPPRRLSASALDLILEVDAEMVLNQEEEPPSDTDPRADTQRAPVIADAAAGSALEAGGDPASDPSLASGDDMADLFEMASVMEATGLLPPASPPWVGPLTCLRGVQIQRRSDGPGFEHALARLRESPTLADAVEVLLTYLVGRWSAAMLLCRIGDTLVPWTAAGDVEGWEELCDCELPLTQGWLSARSLSPGMTMAPLDDDPSARRLSQSLTSQATDQGLALSFVLDQAVLVVFACRWRANAPGDNNADYDELQRELSELTARIDRFSRLPTMRRQSARAGGW